MMTTALPVEGKSKKKHSYSNILKEKVPEVHGEEECREKSKTREKKAYI